MPKSSSFPQFKRPSDAMVYWTLENLCQENSGQCRITIPDLARRCGLSTTTVKKAVSWLNHQDILRYQPGTNQFQPPLFVLPIATNGDCGKVARQPSGRPKNGRPIPYDSDHDLPSNIIRGDDNDIVEKWPTKKQPGMITSDRSKDSSKDRLAHRIAEGLNDMKNLSLYQTYCQRYPEDMILKAFTKAREPSPDKIRVSRGALFNFLVQLYAKKRE